MYTDNYLLLLNDGGIRHTNQYDLLLTQQLYMWHSIYYMYTDKYLLLLNDGGIKHTNQYDLLLTQQPLYVTSHLLYVYR